MGCELAMVGRLVSIKRRDPMCQMLSPARLVGELARNELRLILLPVNFFFSPPRGGKHSVEGTAKANIHGEKNMFARNVIDDGTKAVMRQICRLPYIIDL